MLKMQLIFKKNKTK